MNRRDLLAALGTAAVAGSGGCLGTLDAGTPTPETASEAATTCTDPPWNDPVQLDGRVDTSVEGNRTGFRYDLQMTANFDEGEKRVAVRFAEETDAECAPVAFQRVYELDPGDQTVLRDLVGDPASYVLIVDVKDGGRATQPLDTYEGEIGSATAYFVDVNAGSVRIQKMMA